MVKEEDKFFGAGGGVNWSCPTVGKDIAALFSYPLYPWSTVISLGNINGPRTHLNQVQGDQINMTVFFWYLVKSDFFILFYSTRGTWTSNFFQGARKNTVMFNRSPCSGRRRNLMPLSGSDWREGGGEV